LKSLVDHITEIDHFGEVNWPEANNTRYVFQLHALINGLESLEYHDDDSLTHFGMTCLDAAYGKLTRLHSAKKSLEENGQDFDLPIGKSLAIESRNNDLEKYAQKSGYALMVRRDPKTGHIRIKARPDVDIDLTPLAEKIKTQDPTADWYNHPGGKMLLNSSRKKSHTPSQLTLQQVVDLIKELYD